MPPEQPAQPRPVRLVLYVDDSRFWHDAARLVSKYLAHVGGTVTVVSAALLPGTRARVLEEAARILALPEEQVRLVGRPGLVEYVLPDVAREVGADVVVVGRLGSADRLTSGLIAHLIVRRTPSSVLIARGRPKAIASVLCCTEGSRHGLENFRRAATVAAAFDARLVVLHVLSQMSLTATGEAPGEAGQEAFLASDHPVAAHLRDVRARMREAGLRGGVEVREGLVVEEILDALREGGHDLLVIGAHSTQRKEELLYEDFASHIIRSSPVSTLVVRDGARR